MYTELLAPAKNKEIAIEAINCGADAIYIGANAFGARQNATNSLDDIKEVVSYAHKFWAKVFVTVNTILDDNELINATELIKELDKIGADAVLIQDMGLLEKLKDSDITIPLHASTQCDNRTSEKVRWLSNIGCSRVVLARELSLEQIKQIHQDNPDVELEFFVHGALCVSYSGQCYLSQYIGGRSANRGECAQPCRKKYSVITDDGKMLRENFYALCLKDFNASENLEKMINAGVYSFKIEGRLKDANYVKNITAYYRQELDKYSNKTSSGKSFANFVPNPEKSFNRGFTDYFLNKRTDCFNLDSPKSRGEFIGVVKECKNNYIIIDTAKDLHVQDGLFYENDGFLINKIENNKVYPNKILKIKAGVKIYRNYDSLFEKELEKPVKRQIGASVIVDKKIFVMDEDGISIEIDFDSSEAAKNKSKMEETFIKQFSKTGDSDFYIKEFKIKAEIPFLPVSKINQIRRKCFEKLMEKRLGAYNRDCKKPIKDEKFLCKTSDYRANVLNNSSRQFYEKCECSIQEPALEKIKPKRQIELMRTKHCIKFALNMCKSPQNLILVDEKGAKFPLKFDCKNCEMCVLSEN